jgi:hypothetical protein
MTNAPIKTGDYFKRRRFKGHQGQWITPGPGLVYRAVDVNGSLVSARLAICPCNVDKYGGRARLYIFDLAESDVFMTACRPNNGHGTKKPAADETSEAL